MADSSPCPECDIIILSYGLIPGLCDTLRHRSLAIEEMYGITNVPPALHAQIVSRQEEMIATLKRFNDEQLAVLKMLRDQPRRQS